MSSSWRRCDSCRRVLTVDNYASLEASDRTCLECLAPKPAKRRRASPTVTSKRTTTSKTATSRSEPVVPADPAPIRTMIGRGEPAARRARARAIALEDLTDLYADEYRELLASAATERRGPGRARTELVEAHREEFEQRLADAHEAEGLPRPTFG
jgi:hypothetical protein